MELTTFCGKILLKQVDMVENINILRVATTASFKPVSSNCELARADPALFSDVLRFWVVWSQLQYQSFWLNHICCPVANSTRGRHRLISVLFIMLINGRYCSFAFVSIPLLLVEVMF